MRAVLVVWALLLSLPALPAYGDDGWKVTTRAMSFSESDGRLVVSGAFADVFDEGLLAGLSSGFATTVVLRTYVYAQGEEMPVAFAAATYRVVYDLWEEVYLVSMSSPLGERNLRRSTRAEALKDVTALSGFPVAALSLIPTGTRHYLALVVEVNPVSGELLAEVRRWLTRPYGRAELTGRSFFGSFVSVFANPRLEEAESSLRLRSQPFYRVRQ